MPPLQLLTSFTATGGYRSVSTLAGPDARSDTPWRGQNAWIRPGGRLVPVKGVGAQLSSEDLGARIFAADQYRAEIAGGLVGGTRLPKSSLVRFNASALFFVSELTGQQVYINESISTPYTMTGVTTSSTAGKLRVAVMTSATAFTVYDAGLIAPAAINGAAAGSGTKAMDGKISIVQCARRISTNTTSNPSPATVFTLTAGGNNRVLVTLGLASTGQDAWLFGGTEWARGDQGPWRTIRECRITLTGTVDRTTTALTGTGTRFQRDLRLGDVVTIDGVDYTISAIASDTAATLASGSGSSVGVAVTLKQAMLEWRNGELGELIEFDNDVPPLMDGVAVFNDFLFGWKGNEFYPSKIGNPEAFPAILQRQTQSGGNIVGVHAGDGRIYLLTTNGLEVVNFTQNPDDPFLIRQVWGFGFSAPNQAVVVEGTLYAAVGTSNGVKLVRTRVDDSPDLEFSADVESDMKTWAAERVILSHDPANGAVLAFHRDLLGGPRETTVLPYLLQQGIWSLPQIIINKVVDAVTVNNACEMIIHNGTSYRAYRFENGDGSTTSGYVAWPFVDAPADALRKVIKRLKFTGQADEVFLYAARPGAAAPDVTGISDAAMSSVLSAFNGHHVQAQTNIPNAQSYTVRVNFAGNSAAFSQVDVFGLPNRISR